MRQQVEPGDLAILLPCGIPDHLTQYIGSALTVGKDITSALPPNLFKDVYSPPYYLLPEISPTIFASHLVLLKISPDERIGQQETAQQVLDNLDLRRRQKA